MNILQIAPIVLPIEENMRYGGTERVIQILDKYFVKLGYNSLVAAPGDSKLEGKLVETLPESMWKSRWGTTDKFRISRCCN